MAFPRELSQRGGESPRKRKNCIVKNRQWLRKLKAISRAWMGMIGDYGPRNAIRNLHSTIVA
jgi:hypothetical protein